MPDDYEGPSSTAILIGALMAVLAIVALIWGLHLVYLQYVEGPAMQLHQQNQRHSLDYVTAANQRSEGYIADYVVAEGAGDTSHAGALLNQICSTAGSINDNERSSDVERFYVSNCK